MDLTEVLNAAMARDDAMADKPSQSGFVVGDRVRFLDNFRLLAEGTVRQVYDGLVPVDACRATWISGDDGGVYRRYPPQDWMVRL